MLPASVDCTVITLVKLSINLFWLFTIKLPVIVRVSSNRPVEFTSNPLIGSTDAVTEPLAILNASSESADCGILNKPLPSPLYWDADIEPLISTEPVNCEPLSIEVTTNPSSGVTDAVTLPLAILNASPVNWENGISIKSLPLPLNEPLIESAITICDVIVFVISTEPVIETEPVNCEPLSIDSTLKPLSGETDAVTEPLAINIASSESADCGILNKPLPSPLMIPSSTLSEPLTFIEPVNSCLSVTLSPNWFEPEE